MPQFGEVRVDFITFTTGVSPNEANVTVPVSGLLRNPTFSGNVIISGDLDVYGDITITGNITGDNITATGDLNVSGTGLVVSGVTIGGGLTVSGAGSTYASGLEVSGAFTIDGPYEQTAEAVSALNIDCSSGNYFKKTITGDSTFTFSNVPSSGTACSFTVELVVSGDRTVQWPSGVKFNENESPSLTADRSHLFMFVTSDGGTVFRSSALTNYSG